MAEPHTSRPPAKLGKRPHFSVIQIPKGADIVSVTLLQFFRRLGYEKHFILSLIHRVFIPLQLFDGVFDIVPFEASFAFDQHIGVPSEEKIRKPSTESMLGSFPFPPILIEERRANGFVLSVELLILVMYLFINDPYTSTFVNTTQAFWPPNPKLLDRATRTSALRAVFGT